MRIFVTLILASSALVASAAAEEPLLPAQPQTEAASPATPQQRLNALFTDLKRERDEEKARELANRIRLEWQDSGSATVNLLMQWAEKAIAGEKKTMALDMLDQVIVLAPNYVEGWNRRATLHYQMGNFRKSMSDINRVLALEPRHFGAIAGMATMLEAAGKNELALRAWQQFLDIYPSDRKAQEQLGELSEKLAGSRT
ncbi:tetratricopeptide (TPR) repeat protein [Sinorhizobium kostiense]|uniref:Tetratricopeptide (TPR) repeat protein n=2 Tax=Sinorhizobium kostiense TaxID=76747 RepID=A0ABS4R651_9HYPH|nr:tetratricopeptide (TPR) repeat protein [Sinorhizobium kostiense]